MNRHHHRHHHHHDRPLVPKDNDEDQFYRLKQQLLRNRHHQQHDQLYPTLQLEQEQEEQEERRRTTQQQLDWRQRHHDADGHWWSNLGCRVMFEEEQTLLLSSRQPPASLTSTSSLLSSSASMLENADYSCDKKSRNGGLRSETRGEAALEDISGDSLHSSSSWMDNVSSNEKAADSDYDLAFRLQAQFVLEEEEEEEEEARKEEEKRQRHSSPSSSDLEHHRFSYRSSLSDRAWNFVRRVIHLCSSSTISMTASMATTRNSGDRHLIVSVVEPVAMDDLVFLAERLMVTQQCFRSECRPHRIDVGYHYTRSENMNQIRSDGLMSKWERDASGVIPVAQNGSALGDGVYTASSPTAFHGRYGDVGLIVARLRGFETISTLGTTNHHHQHTPHGQQQQRQHEVDRRHDDDDCIVHQRDQPREVVVLAQSNQCLAMAQFPSSIIDSTPSLRATATTTATSQTASNSTPSAQDGNALIAWYHDQLQSIVDEFFNKEDDDFLGGAALHDDREEDCGHLLWRRCPDELGDDKTEFCHSNNTHKHHDPLRDGHGDGGDDGDDESGTKVSETIIQSRLRQTTPVSPQCHNGDNHDSVVEDVKGVDGVVVAGNKDDNVEEGNSKDTALVDEVKGEEEEEKEEGMPKNQALIVVAAVVQPAKKGMVVEEEQKEEGQDE